MSGLVKNLTILIHAFFLFLSFSLGFLQTVFKTLAITLSFMAVFSGTPLYGPSLLYVSPASLIWEWVVVSFFTWFVGLALAEICSSFPVCFLFVTILFPLDYSSHTHTQVVWAMLQLHSKPTYHYSLPMFTIMFTTVTCLIFCSYYV